MRTSPDTDCRSTDRALRPRATIVPLIVEPTTSSPSLSVISRSPEKVLPGGVAGSRWP